MTTGQEYDDEAAFLAGFSSAKGDRSHEPSPGADKAEVVDVVDRQQVQHQQEDKPQEAEPDPFAALHPEVRKRIDELTAYSQESRRQLGRIADLQSRIDKLAAAVPREPAPPPPRLEKVEKLQQEIPEMADALDELVSQINALKEPPAPPPQPEPVASDQIAEAMTTLDEARPGWREVMPSPAFAAWMMTQPLERQHELQTTRRPSVILKALKEFDSTKAPAPPATNQQAVTPSRMASALQPKTTGPRSLQPEDDDADFLAGFRSVRGNR